MKVIAADVLKKVAEVVTDHGHFEKGEFFILTYEGLSKVVIRGLFIVDDRLIVIHNADKGSGYIASDYLTGLKVPRVQCRLKKYVEPSVRAMFANNRTPMWDSIDVVNCPDFLSGYMALIYHDVPKSAFFKGLKSYLKVKGYKIVL